MMADRAYSRLFLLAICVMIAASVGVGCGGTDASGQGGPFTDHAESSDLQPVSGTSGKGDQVTEHFDRNLIVDDAFFEDAYSVSADDIQAFLDDSPYNDQASPLADYSIGERSAAQMIVDAAHAYGINPLLLLVRIQVEKSLISKAASRSALKHALGCGCYDGQSCDIDYSGFDMQLECAASTYRRRFDDSVADRNVEWKKGKRATSSDGLRVVPANHATAAFYAYTPWVLEGRGGNWLVWNITRRFVEHFQALGINTGAEVADPVRPWIGTPCDSDAACDFSAWGEQAFCYKFTAPDQTVHGFCSLTCRGYCPDLNGKALSFCVADPDQSGGHCASQVSDKNASCADIPGTAPLQAERYIGESSAPASTAAVCSP